ncbi:glycosyltransferase family 4 protein [Pseudalkalibacillus caeni]|uniref:Glycosyltransferase family 4 protein n=1 Tax=Exobacillus caeni TaxID=2574798 RepID=A0A5R9F4P9_9BACL|nr:glycosyltransferase family 4 protein [Pseudalkalibacillus caeni]TLS38497.1 glycosyltransferase family 4 protein [Pseudalkalibacillus caeni]
MKIWILNHVALKPSDIGITRHYDISKELVEKGHKVTIFASSFLAYLFKWRDPKRKNYTENVNDVIFEWVWTLPYKGNGVLRILNMISYLFTSLIRGVKKEEKPDVIVGSSVHLFACLAAYYLSKWKKSTYVVEIRDLWPRTLIDFGAMSERHPVAVMFGIIEKFVYKKADRIIVTLPGAANYISSLGIDSDKIYHIPNGIDLNRIELLENTPSLEVEIKKIKEKHGQVAMYVGSHGMANSLETVVKSAEYLPENQVAYVFVGDGPEKENLKKMANDYENVYFFEGIPKDEVLSTLALGDVLMVSMLDTPLYKYGISLNKLNDYLLVGKPILFAGEVYNDIVGDSGAGKTVPPEDPKAFAEGLNELLKLTDEERIKIRQSAQAYVEDNHDIKKLAERFLSVCQLENTIERGY